MGVVNDFPAEAAIIPDSSDRFSFVAPRRIGRVHQFLRNNKTDLAWGAGNMAFGVAVKLLTASTIAAGGAVGFGVAVGAGLALGTAKALKEQYKERSQIEFEPARTWGEAARREASLLLTRDFGKKVLKNALFGVATTSFGYALAGFAEHTEIGAQAAKAAKDTAGKLTSLFNEKVGAVSAWFKPAAPRTITYDVPHNPIVVAPEPEAAPVVQEKPKTGLRHKLARVVRPVAPDPVTVPVDASVVQQPDWRDEELRRVLSVTSQQDVNATYVRERLAAFVTETTGVQPAADADVMDMAKQVGRDPEAIIRALEQQAPQLDKDHIAVVCKADIPVTYGSENKINTGCHLYKTDMGSKDFALLRNVNDDSPKGLRALTRGIVKAFGGATVPTNTAMFVVNHVNENVQEMVEDAMATSAQLQAVPQ